MYRNLMTLKILLGELVLILYRGYAAASLTIQTF